MPETPELTTMQELMGLFLAARWRTGEQWWRFAGRRFNPTLRALAAHGLVDLLNDNHGGPTHAGRDRFVAAEYVSPLEQQLARVRRLCTAAQDPWGADMFTLPPSQVLAALEGNGRAIRWIDAETTHTGGEVRQDDPVADEPRVLGMIRARNRRRLAATLRAIDGTDPSRTGNEGDDAYARRNTMVLGAVHLAALLGYRHGFTVDPNPADPRFPMVAFIDLPTTNGGTAQISWHLPSYPGVWDGHTADTKTDRIRAYVDATPPVTEATR